ncbi:hypothetical protein [Duncaniella muris]|uniref:hypothetical protein n=1 Tax=Duncaniella muris TaxID=2094150 RepID=UPI003F67FAF2
MLDAIYFLSFCKSFFTGSAPDKTGYPLSWRRTLSMARGKYCLARIPTMELTLGLTAGRRRKSLRRGGKEYDG